MVQMPSDSKYMAVIRYVGFATSATAVPQVTCIQQIKKIKQRDVYFYVYK